MSSNTWAQMIKQEIIDLKLRLTVIESQIKELRETGETTSTSLKTDESAFPSGKMDLLGFGTGKLRGLKQETAELVEATYTLKTAAIAARGYLMLIDQMGLSRDQKKMIRELEYGLMSIMKAAQAFSLFMGMIEASTLNPKAILTIGGYTAGSIAYASKMQGGNV